MEKVSKNISDKMILEDSWLGSENAMELFSIINSSVGLPSYLQMAVEIAEVNTANGGDKSAALHNILGYLYHRLPNDLSEDIKLAIETVKLKEKGEQGLLDYMKMSAQEISDLFSNEKIAVRFGEERVWINPLAANAYADSRSLVNYLHSSKSARAYNHFKESLKLSGKNPEVFRNLIEPNVLMYMLPFVFESHILIDFLKDEYDLAKERLGF